MLLRGLDGKTTIKNAHDRLNAILISGENIGEQRVSFRGGTLDTRMVYHKKFNIWVGYASLAHEDFPKHYYAYGIGDPRKEENRRIVCEINIPIENMTARISGALASDGSSNVYLVHSGKIGGGKKGIGRNHFWENYKGSPILLEYPDGSRKRIAQIGLVDEKSILSRLALFVNEVSRIKGISGERVGTDFVDDLDDVVQDSLLSDCYTPEFSGRKAPYRIENAIEANCYHGDVVAALQKVLAKFNPASDKLRDLYIKDSNENIKFLFEIKTSSNLTCIYSAIGQLMLNSGTSTVGKYLVMLSPQNKSMLTKLKEIGIIPVEYVWEGENVKFICEEELLAQMSADSLVSL